MGAAADELEGCDTTGADAASADVDGAALDAVDAVATDEVGPAGAPSRETRRIPTMSNAAAARIPHPASLRAELVLLTVVSLLAYCLGTPHAGAC
ncbi:MAG: hypothetical protein ABI216_13760 [Devosia sp.]